MQLVLVNNVWQKIKTGLAIAGGVLMFIGIFLAGIFAGRKFPSGGIFGSSAGNSAETSRREAATIENGQRLAGNIGQVKEQNRSAADDNRQASSDNREASANLDGIRSDNNDLGTIAEGLRRIGNSGETWPKK